MSYEQQSADASITKNHESNLQQPLAGNIEFVRQNLEECYVEEGSTSNTWKTSANIKMIKYKFTLKNSVGYVMRKTGGKTCHGDANTNTHGTGEAEYDVGDDEASETELWLGNVET